MQSGQYGRESDPVEYILGITYEIWEEKQVELIRKYYAQDVIVHAMDNCFTGIEPVVEGTYAFQKAYSDRLLLAENVVWSKKENGFYSSHRIFSPMTNTGDTDLAPATNKKVRVRGVADCLIHDGVIIEEWLMRDALPLVRQLALPEDTATRAIADNFTDFSQDWFRSEYERVQNAEHAEHPDHSYFEFATSALITTLVTGEALATHYPHYSVSHRSPIQTASGFNQISEDYQTFRSAFEDRAVTVDHIAFQLFGETGVDLAVRWGFSGKHTGQYEGLKPSNKEVFIMGSTHYRLHQNKISCEWVTFDRLAVMAQML